MTYEYEQYLAHYGIKGQKWGNRRYQNEDGSLTEAGKMRYGHLTEKMEKTEAAANEAYKRASKHSYLHPAHDIMEYRDRKARKAANKYEKFEEKIDKDKYVRNKYGNENIEKFLKDEKKHGDNFNRFYDHASKQKKYQDEIRGMKTIRFSEISDAFRDTKKGKAYHEKYNNFINSMRVDRMSYDWYLDPRRHKN